jgi:NAD(P)-dependent dehydrogenase (short-subunit alcohol dehydrogenase family)
MAIDPPIALITGAARGVGYEVARRLATGGHTVVLAARDPSDASRAAGEIGGRVTALDVGLDVAEPASIDAARSAFGRRYERLDVLINNAAAYVEWSETAAAPDFERAELVLRTNLFGAWRMTVAFLDLLHASAHPRIVNVSSGAGSHGDPTFGLSVSGGAAPAYGVSKAALNALTSALAAGFADSPIIVNAVCPGLTATWPGAEQMGARPAVDSAEGVVWAATLPDDGPRGGFFRDREPLPW